MFSSLRTGETKLSRSVWMVAAVLVSASCAMVVSLVVGADANVVKVSNYFTGASAVALTSMVILLGMNRAAVYFSARYKDDTDVLLSITDTIVLGVLRNGAVLIGLACVAILVIEARDLREGGYFETLLVLASAWALAVNTVLLNVLNGTDRIRELATARMLRWVTYTATVVAILLRYTEVSFLAHFAVGEAVVLLYAGRELKRSCGFDIRRWSKGPRNESRKKEIHAYSHRAAIGQVVNAVNERGDVLLIALLFNAPVVAVYGFTTTIVKGSFLFGVAHQQLFNPGAARAFLSGDLPVYTGGGRREGAYLGAIALIGMIVGYWAVTSSIPNLGKYSAFTFEFALMAFGASVFVSKQYAGGLLAMANKLRQNNLRIFATLLLNFSLLFALAGLETVTALAWYFMLYMLMATGTNALWVRKFLGVRI